jgi:hypothetical protein
VATAGAWGPERRGVDAADKQKTAAAGASSGGFQPELGLAGGSLGTRGSRRGNAAVGGWAAASGDAGRKGNRGREPL